MKIILADIREDIVLAWRKRFGYTGPRIAHASLLDIVAVDAIVSPGNSFGFMDGNFDLLISQRYGWCIQAELRRRIEQDHDGELLVGQAEAIKSPDGVTIISAPTMRVPMDIRGTPNAYLATKAALRVARSIGADTVAMPGMGAGAGMLSPDVVAYQMHAAICGLPTPRSWREAAYVHVQLSGTLQNKPI